jgi:hypothetical protein
MGKEFKFRRPMIGFHTFLRISNCMAKTRLCIATIILSCFALPVMLLAQGSGITVTVSPQSETTYIGKTRQYTATVMGSMNMGVKWAINGVAGGGGMFGSIS